MEGKKREKSLYGKLLRMNLIPLFLLVVIITSFSAKSFADALNREVKNGLMDLTTTIMTLYQNLYPGDFRMVESEGAIYLLKGEHQINGDFTIIDTIKADTGTDITFLYQDIRVITTLKDESGDRLIGTKVNAVVIKDVLEKKQPAFYPNVSIGEKEYFAYYMPLINSDGSCVGMLFVAKPTKEVYDSIRSTVSPIVALGIVAMVLVGLVTLRFSNNLIRSISGIEKFLGKVAQGNLNNKLDYEVYRREDELGEMGRYAIDMQKSLCELVEKDVLTDLYNRRSGEKRLMQAYKDKFTKNIDFCIAVGDIDHFKQVNDNYGHDCGDLVLSEVAAIMKKAMCGKGVAARWGGEEFILLFNDCKLEKAVILLNEIMEKIRETEVIYEKEARVRITMTFGICQGNVEGVDAVLREADEKLYYGKNNGRNQIVQ